MLTGYVVPYGKSVISDSHLFLNGSSSDHRLCANWNQCATGTGRLSCRGPNLQALPRAKAESTKQEKSNTLKEDDAQGSESLCEQEKTVDDYYGRNGDDKAAASPSQLIPSSPLLQPEGDSSELRPILLPSDVNMRNSVVPTSSQGIRQIERDLRSSWNFELHQLIQPNQHNQTDDMSNCSHLPPSSEPRCQISADYSQMEVRLLAQLCQDKDLIRVFNVNESEPTSAAAASSSSASSVPSMSSLTGDVYRRMASIMFQKSIADVSDNERTISKTIVLGVIYGMGAESLAGKLTKFSKRQVPTSEALQYIHRLYQQFPKITAFMAQTKEGAKRQVSQIKQQDTLCHSSTV